MKCIILTLTWWHPGITPLSPQQTVHLVLLALTRHKLVATRAGNRDLGAESGVHR